MSDREKERKHLIPKVKAIYRHADILEVSYGTHRMSEELTADGEPYGHGQNCVLAKLLPTAVSTISDGPIFCLTNITASL